MPVVLCIYCPSFHIWVASEKLHQPDGLFGGEPQLAKNLSVGHSVKKILSPKQCCGIPLIQFPAYT